ncbi:SDR family NAD(P)-dependent oxidoreductase [Kitasatospora nipponensis]|uniref:SDR family NAD(P)-dependent oxidoreductase n=1 Tax=Kitasatospora nipponensis TaxID=258049 RepID=A0ABP4HRQ5_9ACTN
MGTGQQKVAVVTGASSGIGAATARRLATEGFSVIVTARRTERIEELAKEIESQGGSASAVTLDVTDRAAVDAFAAGLERLDLLVNNAGGAFGAESVEQGDPADWLAMYQVNVLGVLHMTQALLPALRESGDGTVLILSSTAALAAYEGGGGYVAAKHAAHTIAATLRLELVGEPIRVIEIAPGMVKSEGFAVTRFRGDEARAAAVYQGVSHPLTSQDIADTVAWAVTRPSHVNIDLLVVRPRAQASNYKVHRD